MGNWYVRRPRARVASSCHTATRAGSVFTVAVLFGNGCYQLYLSGAVRTNRTTGAFLKLDRDLAKFDVVAFVCLVIVTGLNPTLRANAVFPSVVFLKGTFVPPTGRARTDVSSLSELEKLVLAPPNLAFTGVNRILECAFPRPGGALFCASAQGESTAITPTTIARRENIESPAMTHHLPDTHPNDA